MQDNSFEKIAIIGCGVMGSLFARAWVQNKCIARENLILVDVYSEKQQEISHELSIPESNQGIAAVANASLVVIAVKPQSFSELVVQLQSVLPTTAVILSIMAGIPVIEISRQLPDHSVIRVMPNTPSGLGKGVLGWFSSHADQYAMEIERLLSPLGVVIPLQQEVELHTITAVAGSGPAWMFYVLQSLADFAEKQGFSPDQARQLAIQTMQGSAMIAETSPLTFSELIQRVASKGGTTEAGLRTLEENNVSGGFEKAMQAALEKSKELAGEQ